MGRTGRPVNDLTGMRFGNLVVLYRGDKRGKSKKSIHWNCLCDCGEVVQVRGWHLKSGHSASCGCARTWTDGNKGRIGPLHPNWNPTLTNEERIQGRNIPGYKEWRSAVYERDNYTCQKCGDNRGGNLIAHHIEGYAANKKLRIKLGNGVTLCEDCHKDFHHLYGLGNNTREQYEEWISK